MCQRPSLTISNNKQSDNNKQNIKQQSQTNNNLSNNNTDNNNTHSATNHEHDDDDDNHMLTPLVNAALTKNPEYAKILFGKLTTKQQLNIHYKPMYEWIKCWIGLITYAYYSEYIPKWLFLLFIVQRVGIHTNAGHDSIHLPSKPIWGYRVFGSILFLGGFVPIAPCVTDIRSAHCHFHHRTKGPLSPSKYDEDSKWASLPLWQMALNFFLMPGHASVIDIVFHQYPSLKASLEERLTTNFFHYAQLVTMYKLLNDPSLFLQILLTGHVTMFLVWITFSGFVHRASFYEFMLSIDATGRRRIPYVDPILYALVGRGLITEVKFHDIHHTHGAYVRSLACQYERSDGTYGWDEIEEACAAIVDEGLLVDPITLKPMSGVSEIGHQINSRKRL